MRVILLCVLGVLSVSVVHAQTYYDGATGAVVGSAAFFEKIRPGQILIVSEFHDNKVHHQNQVEILTQIARQGLPVSVGMEFFDYTDQNYVDEYTAGRLGEIEFLNLIKWNGWPFSFYRQQVQFPHQNGGRTLALNLPRRISGKVSKGGLEALTEEEKALLPPDFEIGRDTYLERFREFMKGHATEEQIHNYFTAHSLWDETMAWQSVKYMEASPEKVLMIIVGDFHVAYQDGLIARLKARGHHDILSVSQIDTEGLTEIQRQAEIQPHQRYGSRADFIFDAAAGSNPQLASGLMK